MRAVSVFFVASIAFSAGIPHSTFRYELYKTFNQDEDACQLCYGDECTKIEENRCEYYMEVDELIEKPSEEGQVTEVDAMVYDLTEQADRSWVVQKCIPLISHYTDCTKDSQNYSYLEKNLARNSVFFVNMHNIFKEGMTFRLYRSENKDTGNEFHSFAVRMMNVEAKRFERIDENICGGCLSCSCNVVGQWSCRYVQRCTPEPERDVDHKMLVLVMEKLNELKNEKNLGRKKRTASSGFTKKPEVKRMSFLDIAEWMYGVRPNITKKEALKDNVDIVTTTALPKQTESYLAQTSLKSTDQDYLDFAEVLKNIAFEEQSYKRRKSPLNLDNGVGQDNNKDTQYININNGSSVDRFIEALRAVEDKWFTESDIDGANFVVNLIPKAIDKNKFSYNDTKDDFEINNIINKASDYNNTFDFDISNEKIELNAINVMKRDISYVSVTDSTNTTHATYTTSIPSEASTNAEGIILENVLTPLTNIINDKTNEVKELMEIRERLIHFINNYDKSKLNVTKNFDVINGNNSHIAVYKLDLHPEIEVSLRKTNPNLLEKLQYKLKRDIFEVLKDIAKIQTLSKTYELPDDIKYLIRSIQRFIYTQDVLQDFEKKNRTQINRRLMSDKQDLKYPTNHNSINKQLLDIIEVIDKNKPSSNALILLSKSTKKIMKRVIDQNHVHNFNYAGHKMNDYQYNLTHDLNKIGKSWPRLTACIIRSSPHGKIYALKLFHIVLIEDVSKLADAMSFVQFAHSRRMVSIGARTAESVMDSISEGLKSIKTKILELIRSEMVTKGPLRENINKKNEKKLSFFKKIRKLLRHPKLDVFNMVKKKTSNSARVNKFADQRLNDLEDTDDESTMLKWQKYLSMARRKKREMHSHFRGINNMIKSIIPKYLQGKINPALVTHHKTEKPRSIQRWN